MSWANNYSMPWNAPLSSKRNITSVVSAKLLFLEHLS